MQCRPECDMLGLHLYCNVEESMALTMTRAGQGLPRDTGHEGVVRSLKSSITNVQIYVLKMHGVFFP